MSRVCVVIPAHEPGPWLQRSLDSVLAQEGVELEVVVVDDGSTEDLSWVAAHADPRVRYVRQPNRGVSVARNVGVALTSADWVALLDQDDEWLADKLARQLALAERQPDAAFIATGFEWVLPSGPVTKHCPVLDYPGVLSGEHTVCLSSVLVRRDRYLAVGGHSPLLLQQQDSGLLLDLLRAFGPAATVADPLVRYHVHRDNTSRDYATAAREWEALLDAHEALARRASDRVVLAAIATGRRAGRRHYGRLAVTSAADARRDGSSLTGVGRHLAAGARLNPGHLVRSVARTMARTMAKSARTRVGPRGPSGAAGSQR